jgi:hypothetical protein
MNKLKIVESTPPSWKEKESAWDAKAADYKKNHPLKTLRSLPKMVGITAKTARFLRLRSLFYILTQDKKNTFLRYFFKRPFAYTLSLLSSYLRRKSFSRKDDLFFYGIKDEDEFTKLLSDEKTLAIVGFSYCHKPLECPSGRFTDQCENIQDHPACSQCFIGKCSHLLSSTKAKLLYIPTIHYIGEEIFKATLENPDKNIIFLITACEMSLEMFGDWGNMVKARGLGIRLDGRICNTMRAFKLSEEGIKPGLTVVLDPTQEKILNLLQPLHKGASV